MEQLGTTDRERLAAYGTVSTALALCSDEQLADLVDAATPLGSGIGGRSSLLEVDGTPVFVKRVPLTDLERLPEHARSTANLFGLPAFCQYGLGGPSSGVWRELAVHIMTTNWVLTGENPGFPLTYHWRVLPDSAPLPEELADVDRVVAYWDGGSQVRRRIDELRESSASVTLFLEYIPQNLREWLGEQVKAGDEEVTETCLRVEQALHAGTSFMNTRGLLHFDAHFENILTDGRRLYFADYGLALSSRFELSEEEAGFFDRHQVYDRCYTLTSLVIWLASALNGSGGEDADALLRAYARGEGPTGIPAAAAAILSRYAPLAAVLKEFNRRLRQESRLTPYPLEEILRISARDGVSLT
ncbi:protein kinase family protein [Streptomyces sp. NBC_01198]|uniref:protein kinase family protein n=1 Tax=Streptomyces sp. NBC_01198 TaxID=2903769 RepID=UPI002E0EA208|nr:protein kinase family protein [Streptomyces sp. NBC_01198]